MALSQAASNIRSQLIAEKALYKYKYGNDSLDPWLTATLAALIASQCNSIMDIGETNVDYVLTNNYSTVSFDDSESLGVAGVENSIVHGKAYYNKITGAVFSGIGGADSVDPNTLDSRNGIPIIDVNLFASTENGDYFANYLIKYNAQGVPYFLIRLIAKQKSHGVFGDLFAAIAPIAPLIALGLNFALPGAGALLGEAIFGELAATLPALSAAVGDIAIQTALNGGNIESAVKGVVVGAVGGFAGENVGVALDSAVIGRAAASATSALVGGGDLRKAVLTSLVSSGVNSVGDSKMPRLSNATDVFVSDIPLDDSSGASDSYSIDFPSSADDAIFNQGVLDQLPVMRPSDVYTGGDYGQLPMTPGDIFGGGGGSVPPLSPTQQTNATEQLLSIVATAGRMAIAWNAAGRQPVRLPGAQYNGGTVTASSDGTITTMRGSQRQNTVPPVGQVFTTAQGELINNNGDGTYNIVGLNGSVQTRNYRKTATPKSQSGASFQFSAIPPMAWAAGAALLIAALK